MDITDIDFLSSTQPVALYRLPQTKTPLLLQATAAVPLANLCDLPIDKSGFVIAPFDLHSSHWAWFYEGKPVPITIPTACLQTLGQPQKPDAESQQQERRRYAEAFNHVHDAVASKTVEKVVLARSRTLKAETFSPSAVFTALANHYNDAFVFLFSTPEEEWWFGASPECLLKGNGTAWETEALAGTMSAAEMTPENPWNAKNRNEHACVADYIANILTKQSLDVQRQPLSVKQAGQLLHLHTTFYAQGKRQAGDLLSQLHPTPAVCGMPLEEARRIIQQHETCQRKYYGGFAGSIAPEEVALYVNLRSGYYRNGQITLYAGGGIMPESVLPQEWQETEMKLNTLQRLFS